MGLVNPNTNVMLQALQMFAFPFQPWTDLNLSQANDDFTIIGSNDPYNTFYGDDILNRSPNNGINNADDLPEFQINEGLASADFVLDFTLNNLPSG